MHSVPYNLYYLNSKVEINDINQHCKYFSRLDIKLIKFSITLSSVSFKTLLSASENFGEESANDVQNRWNGTLLSSRTPVKHFFIV